MSRVQAVDSRAEADARVHQSDDQRQQINSPWLTSHEACDYLRYVGKHRLRTLYRFLGDHGIATARRGTRRLLIARRDLERAIGARR